jgi:hypothetical protein
MLLLPLRFDWKSRIPFKEYRRYCCKARRTAEVQVQGINQLPARLNNRSETRASYVADTSFEPIDEYLSAISSALQSDQGK